MEDLLKVSELSLYVKEYNREKKILDSLNFEIFSSEIVAVVGESGCGKTMLARTLLRLNSERIFRAEGDILFENTSVMKLSDRQILAIRGRKIGFVFQEPISYLNPTMKIGDQISEMPVKHLGMKKQRAMTNVERLLAFLGIKDIPNYTCQYPHQLSGGLAQRGMIATAASCNPRLIIADEPTSALDAFTQLEIVKLIKHLNREYGISFLFITHDMELAYHIADRVIVMSKGAIAETGKIENVFKAPNSEVTKRLLNSAFGNILHEDRKLETPCYKINNNETVIEIKDIKKHFTCGTKGIIKAVDGISLEIFRGETLGILGESGCGKSTLARLLTRIIKADSGSILFQGVEIEKVCMYQNCVQMVFQDPISSMNPRMRIQDIVSEGLDINGLCRDGSQRKALVEEILDKVGLGSMFLNRYPHELSGGQRQRVCIARSLIMKPGMLVLDEPTSYLDAVSQSQILDLFSKIKKELGLTYLLVTHNLKVLARMCDRIAVMLNGNIVEVGSSREILKNPKHQYTRNLTDGLGLVKI